MSRYTIKNLKEVEDSAQQFGLAPNIEARFARKELDGALSGISYQRLARNFRMPFGHRHKTQEETYVVLHGSARAKLDDEVVELREWDALRVPPDTMRCLEAGRDGVELLVFGAGDAGDVEMVQGWWIDEATV